MPTGQGGSVCPTAKGELCAQEYTSNSIPQMRHSPAEDSLVCPVSPGKMPRLLSRHSHPCPARLQLGRFSFVLQMLRTTPKPGPCCSCAWNSLPVDRQAAATSHTEVSTQPPSPQRALTKPPDARGSLSRHPWWHPLVTMTLPQCPSC